MGLYTLPASCPFWSTRSNSGTGVFYMYNMVEKSMYMCRAVQTQSRWKELVYTFVVSLMPPSVLLGHASSGSRAVK